MVILFAFLDVLDSSLELTLALIIHVLYKKYVTQIR